MHISEGQQVVVAYDFSNTAEVALTAAITLASRAPQHVLHVVVAIDDDHRVPGLPTNKVDYAYTEKVHEHLTSKLQTVFETSAPGAEIHFFVHVRIGKPALHELLLRWTARLAPGGEAHLVVQKHLGSDSLQRWSVEQGLSTDRVATGAGFGDSCPLRTTTTARPAIKVNAATEPRNTRRRP